MDVDQHGNHGSEEDERNAESNVLYIVIQSANENHDQHPGDGVKQLLITSHRRYTPLMASQSHCEYAASPDAPAPTASAFLSVDTACAAGTPVITIDARHFDQAACCSCVASAGKPGWPSGRLVHPAVREWQSISAACENGMALHVNAITTVAVAGMMRHLAELLMMVPPLCFGDGHWQELKHFAS